MDELNAHQFWGLSPLVDLLAAAGEAQAAAPCDTRGGGAPPPPPPLLQACPYDCRHTLATVCSHLRRQQARSDHRAGNSPHEGTEPERLQLYVYEPEPELLARHMLLLALLFEPSMTPRERAEAFLELHGNALLRQRTAEWLGSASVWLEEAVAHSAEPQQRQQHAHCPAAALGLFDLNMLRHRERDALVDACRAFRSKARYDMAAAWEWRCRKWYGDRYDCRNNLVDWDYHMRLSPRGTPWLDPADGSIVHFFHFRHWRLTGVAHELRESSYTAANTSLLATAYGRTREYKDRNLRDVGRSVAALGFWGDVLNPPYHAFGTLADEPRLFSRVNKQFSHTALDVAEHNVLGFIATLCGAPAAASKAAERPAASGSAGGSGSDGAAAAAAPHRANAARGPTSMERLTAEQHEQQPASPAPAQEPSCTGVAAATANSSSTACSPAADEAAADVPCGDQPAQALPPMGSKQQQERPALGQQQLAAAVQRVQRSVRIHLLTGNLRRALASRPGLAHSCAAATVGHRHMHLLGPEHGLAGVLRDGAPVLVETAQYLVQLSSEQVAAFEAGVLQLAAAAGFVQHPAFAGGQRQPEARSSGAAAAAVGGGVQQQQAAVGSWRLPPGHVALARAVQL